VKTGGAKGQRVRAILKRYEGIAWTFRDDGGVVASDVIGQDAGRVEAGGVYVQESRHSARVVAWAVLKAMERDKARVWGSRWLELVEREGRPSLPEDVGEVLPPGVAARRALAEKRRLEREAKARGE
jgi:hypothetical protein